MPTYTRNNQITSRKAGESHHYFRGKDKRTHRKTPKAIQPQSDPALETVFARIGNPDPTSFTPDPFQLEALNAIRKSDCLVTAPTGAGKTWIAEKAIHLTHAEGGRCWYASPLKALTNSKRIEFGTIFGNEAVGILTGDTKENTDAPIIVGTTEILRNKLYEAMYRGENLNYDLVILDEAHFLGDKDRGVVWEEVMIYLPVRVRLLLLSATIGNNREIAEWLSSLRRKECTVVEDTTRPVPLYPLFLDPPGTLAPLLSDGTLHTVPVAWFAKNREASPV